MSLRIAVSGRIEGSVGDPGSEIDLEVTRETHEPSDILLTTLSQPTSGCTKRGLLLLIEEKSMSEARRENPKWENGKMGRVWAKRMYSRVAFGCCSTRHTR